MPNDDLEERDIDDEESILDSDESDDVFSIGKWVTKSLIHIVFTIFVVICIIGLVIGTKYVYGRLGDPVEKQQTGLGILEWEK